MNFDDFLLFREGAARIRIDSTKHNTPPNFEGIDRRITYANRKYHSGWMCIGAMRGFAWLKFSVSINNNGFFDVVKIISVEIIITGTKSLIDIIGWKFILSVFVFVTIGFDDPFSWSEIRWIIIVAIIIIGTKKCSEKNRFNVGWDTEPPPHIHLMIGSPRIGIAEIVPVITVAPQKDICPHGRTYPKNAVAISIIIKIIPDIHVFFWFLGDEK